MSDEKKGGFFRRMFSRFKKEEPVEEAPVVEATPEEAAPEEAPTALAQPEATPEPAPITASEPVEVPPAQPEPEPEPEPEPIETLKEEVPAPVEVSTPEIVPEPESEPKRQVEETSSWFSRLKTGLSKSSRALTSGITQIFTHRKLDDATLEELEDILIQADLGIETAMKITEAVGKDRYDKQVTPEEVNKILSDEIAAVLEPVAIPFEFDDKQKPFVILVVGVNGAGKTTTIGKLAAIATRENFSITLAAGDTFRAAAIDQLKIWSERTGADFISHKVGSDAASLAFDAMKQAKANNTDILMLDTAGRLQNRTELMDELEKIVRVLRKQDATAPHSVLLVLDATVGQNAISQVEVFQKVAGVTGLIMTKLDGTARGGILVAISAKFGLPIHAIGVGEEVDDLQPFDAREFADAIVGATTPTNET